MEVYVLFVGLDLLKGNFFLQVKNFRDDKIEN